MCLVAATCLLPGCGSGQGDDVASAEPRAGDVVLPSGRTIRFGHMIENGVAISVPRNGTTVRPGTDLVVQVEARSGFRPQRILVGCEYGTALVDSASSGAKISIPEDAFGRFELTVLAFDDENNAATSPATTVQVEPEAAMLRLRVDRFMIYLDEQVQLRVFGEFDDGVDRRVASSDTSTKYESLDTSVATIDHEGIAHAISPGTARFRVRHGDFAAAVEAPVQLLSEQVDRDLQSIGSASPASDGGT